MRKLAPLLIVAAAATLLLAPAGAPATRENKICPTLTGHAWHSDGKTGTKYSWEVIGRAFTCGSAKHWVLAFVGTRVRGTAAQVPLHGGPAGYHCFGSRDARGYAYMGLCYQKTRAFPKNGFAWFSA
jgi:hypothetical protein